MKTKMMIRMVVIVAVGMFLTACVVSPIAGVAPGLKTNVIKMPSSSNVPVVASVMLDQKMIISQILIQAEDAWNNKDTENFLRHYAEDAKVMVGREQRIVTKVVYIKMFPAAFEVTGTVKYETLKVEMIDENNAEAQGVVHVSAADVWLTKKLKLENRGGKWLITESMFAVYSKGDSRHQGRGGDSPS